MKKSSATFRDVGRFIAGLLVGLSIGILVFAMMDEFTGAWQTLLVFGAPIILALAITLEIVATYTNKPRPRRRTDPALHVLPIELMESSQVR
jgi:predicted lipid-binding transport protein (Tim44 family)